MAAKRIKFEEAMQRLQEIVNKLESGEETLEFSRLRCEEGAKLSAQCYQMLDKAEQQVIELTKIANQEDDGDEGDL